jgi:hypothetical protein
MKVLVEHSGRRQRHILHNAPHVKRSGIEKANRHSDGERIVVKLQLVDVIFSIHNTNTQDSGLRFKSKKGRSQIEVYGAPDSRFFWAAIALE